LSHGESTDYILSSLRNDFITLHLAYLKSLHSKMQRFFQSWVDEAPEDYKLDGFLTNHVPITITSLYGQNQPLPILEEQESEDAMNWSRIRNFGLMKYVSFSLASHVE
jgi:hypothetical protein